MSLFRKQFMFIKTFIAKHLQFGNYYLILSHNQILRFNKEGSNFHLYENRQFILENKWKDMSKIFN